MGLGMWRGVGMWCGVGMWRGHVAWGCLCTFLEEDPSGLAFLALAPSQKGMRCEICECMSNAGSKGHNAGSEGHMPQWVTCDVGGARALMSKKPLVS